MATRLELTITCENEEDIYKSIPEIIEMVKQGYSLYKVTNDGKAVYDFDMEERDNTSVSEEVEEKQKEIRDCFTDLVKDAVLESDNNVNEIIKEMKKEMSYAKWISEKEIISTVKSTYAAFKNRKAEGH